MQRVLGKSDTAGAASSVQPVQGVFASIMDADNKQHQVAFLF